MTCLEYAGLAKGGLCSVIINSPIPSSVQYGSVVHNLTAYKLIVEIDSIKQVQPDFNSIPTTNPKSQEKFQ